MGLKTMLVSSSRSRGRCIPLYVSFANNKHHIRTFDVGHFLVELQAIPLEICSQSLLMSEQGGVPQKRRSWRGRKVKLEVELQGWQPTAVIG